MISKQLQQQARKLGIDRYAQKMIEKHTAGGLADFIQYKLEFDSLEPQIKAIATKLGLNTRFEEEDFEDYVSEVTSIVMRLRGYE